MNHLKIDFALWAATGLAALGCLTTLRSKDRCILVPNSSLLNAAVEVLETK